MNNLETDIMNFIRNNKDSKFYEVIKGYKFLHISQKLILMEDDKIFNQMKESKIIMINSYKNYTLRCSLFIIGFRQTILIIPENNLSFLSDLFSLKENPLICFLTKEQDIFRSQLKINFQEIEFDSTFQNQVEDFSLKAFSSIPNSFIDELWTFIQPCILGFLIKQSYLKLKKDRIKELKFFKKNILNSSTKINQNEYIEINIIGNSSISVVCSAYHIKKEEIFAIKKTIEIDSLNREIDIYLHISHPFFPKFYNFINESSQIYLGIELIDGCTLSNIKDFHFTENEKITIIFELMLTLEYIHRNGYVYSDLKPNNVLIDQNKSIVLIDFNNMIKSDSSYIDIISLGKMIHFIITEKSEFETNTPITDNAFYRKIYREILRIYLLCFETNQELENKYFISKLMLDYYIQYHSNIQINNFFENYQEYLNDIYDKETINTIINFDKNENNIEIQFILGSYYHHGKNVIKDITKAVYYYTLAANSNHVQAKQKLYLISAESSITKTNLQFELERIICLFYEKFKVSSFEELIIQYTQLACQNNSSAQFKLGEIYEKGDYVQQDIKLAIHYYTLAANQNHCNSQFKLGKIFENAQSINRSIYYYTLSANQGNSEASFNLGMIYYLGKYIMRNMNKALYYLSLAANQNDIVAQYNLGVIYERGEDVLPDIKKSIHYYTLSANQNYQYAQLNLGIIYEKGKLIRQDIKKALFYYEKAANQHNAKALYALGTLYYEGIYIERDIGKAINYFQCSADQNYSDAYFILGYIYSTNNMIRQDINIVIKYYTDASNLNNAKAQFHLGVVYQFKLKDIKKSIFYYSLAANQNIAQAQFNLGIIYYNGLCGNRDIEKAIYYFKLASKQNLKEAHFILGVIYHNETLVPHDITKAIYYYKLAVDQNYARAQINLGTIYFTHYKNIEKAIYYFLAASHQNFPEASFNLYSIYKDIDLYKALYFLEISAKQKYDKANFLLAQIYQKGMFNIQRDIKKAIFYYEQSANFNNPEAQYYLFNFYYKGKEIPPNIYKGIDFLIRSSNNGYNYAYFSLGCLYHFGKFFKRDIIKAINCYKNSINLYNDFAKNNIGVLYKNGFGDEINKNISLAIEYLNESSKNNDILSLYNLAHIYFYEEDYYNIDKSIFYLIICSNLDFKPSLILLCLVLIKKHGLDIDKMENEIDNNNLFNKLCYIINECDLLNTSVFKLYIDKYRTVDYLYDEIGDMVISASVFKVQNKPKIQTKPNITAEFYEGFGIDL